MVLRLYPYALYGWPYNGLYPQYAPVSPQVTPLYIACVLYCLSLPHFYTCKLMHLVLSEH